MNLKSGFMDGCTSKFVQRFEIDTAKARQGRLKVVVKKHFADRIGSSVLKLLIYYCSTIQINNIRLSTASNVKTKNIVRCLLSL